MIVLDASVLIAFLDPTDAHHSSARDLVRSASGQALGASVLTIAEVMVAPVRAGRTAVVDDALDALRVQRLALTADVVVALAELRVSSGLRMPDCCVLLAAHATGGTVATFDNRLADAARALGLDTTS